MRADLFGGKHHGEWLADFTTAPPNYSAEGTVERVSLPQLGELMHDHWITGSASAAYQLKMVGYNSTTLLASASGLLRFDMREGMFPHIALGSAPLHVRHFSGLLTLHDGEFEIRDSKLESTNGVFLVNGTASVSNKLDFKLVHEGAPGFSITGTLAEPQTSHTETQAALRPSTQR